MKVTGFYQMISKEGEIKRYRGISFESTEKKFSDGKVIWQKVGKDGSRHNVFCEQFIPDVPWLPRGKWFIEVDAGWVLQEYPTLKVETERSKSMTDKEYTDWLSKSFNDRYQANIDKLLAK